MLYILLTFVPQPVFGQRIHNLDEFYPWSISGITIEREEIFVVEKAKEAISNAVGQLDDLHFKGHMASVVKY